MNDKINIMIVEDDEILSREILLFLWNGKKQGKWILLFLFVCGAYNGYFLFFLLSRKFELDIRRIFEKGFTGQNHHNGKYKSTGMGLYMVSVILKRLGHRIDAESLPGSYTRFTLTFTDNREHFFCQ